MAEIITYVNTDAAAGGDGTTSGITGGTRAYATLDEWEAAEQTNLVGAGNTHTVKCLGSAAHTDRLTVAGWTTGPDNGIHITVHEDRRHNGIAGISDCIINPDSNGHVFTIGQNNVEVSYLDITDWQGNSAEAFRITDTSGVFHHLIIHDSPNANADAFYPNWSAPSGEIFIYNCMAWNLERAFVMIQQEEDKAIYVYNCTALNIGTTDDETMRGIICADTQFGDDGITVFCKNVVASGKEFPANVTAFKGKNGVTIVCENCAANDGSPISGSFVSNVGGNHLPINIADQFVATATSGFDLHLAANSVLEGSGLDLSSDVNLPFSDDIDGIERVAPWDVGADEIITAITGDTFDTWDGTYRMVGDQGVQATQFGWYRFANGKLYLPVVANLEAVATPAENQVVFINTSGKLAFYHGLSGWMVSAQGT